MQVLHLADAGSTPRLCVGLPTRNEAEGIAFVLCKVAAVLKAEPVSIMVLDDSDDATCAQVEAFAQTPTVHPHELILVHREPEERQGKLGSIVMTGLELAEKQGAEYFALMDGDGQHPPEIIPRLLAKAEETGADLVVASRYADGGKAAGLSPARLVVSRSVTRLTKLLFPRRLAGLSDVASGMFLVRVKSVDPARVYADGFKILFSLASVHDWYCEEVPYVFGDRVAGQSKAGAGEGLRFLRLVAAVRIRNWGVGVRPRHPQHA